MKRNYKKKPNLINKTGYTPGYSTEKNPVNYIPSEDITMANTPYPVYATPLDQNGNPMGNGMVMQPGGEYKFKGASYVEEIPLFQTGGRNKIAPSLERQLLNKYVTPSTNRAMARAKQQGIRTGIHNGGLDAIRHSSSAAATSSILPSWVNFLPGGLSANIAMTNLAGLAHEVNSPNSFKEHASDLYNNFVGSVVGTLPITEERKHDLLIEAQKNGILSDMGNKRPLNNKQTRPSNSKQNNMDNTTNSAFNRNIRGKRNFNQFLLGDTPEFRKGGQKSDWISDKISTLVREGYPQKQAVAIAYSMYENKHGNGGYQLPMYQTAGMFGNNQFGQKDKFTPNPSIASPEQFSEQMKKTAEIKPTDYGLGVDPNKPNPLSEESLTAGQDFAKRAEDYTNSKGVQLPQNFDKNIFGEEGSNEKEKSDIAPLDVKGEQPFQFFNPYSGFDIPTAASTLGLSIESGDTFGTVASGLKLATGLARNFLGGMGQERRKNYMTQQSYEKQREGMTGAGREEMKRFGGYYQEGGMQPGMEEGMEQPQGGDIQQQVAEALQQGASPEEVMQQLIQIGMPEDQAMALVQGIMEQMQPSTPQLKRGGMMYYEDGGEDEYGYEDEEENYMINKPSLMGRQQNFSQSTNESMETSTEPNIEPETEEEETPSYDKNSARDTWVAKTGMPWSEAKRLGYTSGSAKDNMKLLSELNDPRFKKEYLRGKPLSPARASNKNYTQEELWGKPLVTPVQKYINDMGKYSSSKSRVPVKANPQNSPFTSLNQNNPFMPGQQFSLPAGAREIKKPKTKANWEIYKENIGSWLNSNAPIMFQPRFYQDGGEQQIAQQVAQAMQQGMQPQEAMAMLMESGMTEDQAMQMVQAIMQQLQQGQQMEEGTPQMRRGGRYCQEGGEMMEEDMEEENEGAENESAMSEQIEDQVEQALQQGADPQEILQQLVQMGMPQEEAMQMIQEILQEMQGGEEEEEGTPQMSKGGKYMRALVGKTIKNYTYNPKTDSYIVSYE